MSDADDPKLTLNDALMGTLLGACLKIGEAKAAKERARRMEANAIAAGFGDLAALQELASFSWSIVSGTDDEDRKAIAFVEAITFARLAAAHGEPLDSENLMFLLCEFGRWQRERGRDDLCMTFEAAGLNIADALADGGNEAMAEMIAKAGSVVPPETFAEAKRQREAPQ